MKRTVIVFGSTIGFWGVKGVRAEMDRKPKKFDLGPKQKIHFHFIDMKSLLNLDRF